MLRVKLLKDSLRNFPNAKILQRRAMMRDYPSIQRFPLGSLQVLKTFNHVRKSHRKRYWDFVMNVMKIAEL